ncbi:acyltransferase family protein [Ktedonobacter racemifer]|uniref:Acyltransferase 3 n=1 Tax=Ktedonobacter racemifer DSM 44963 TaxID=485913 RepID=D6TBU4_KTERA|nr:acyltransferase [Ktedonobacter racemifer]EFH89876.1 acyltransferase 3 [Ktedonobacter racemifer DSM 44963]
MSTTYSSLADLQVSLKRKWFEYTQKVTASLEVKQQKSHLLVLDGVRAVACLAVLLHHMIYHVILPAGLWHPSGTIQVLLAALLNFGGSGVILFFLLSSFLLFLPFAQALLFDRQWPSISRFYIRRFFRIVPGYYAAIILMVLFFHPEFLHTAQRVKLLEFFTFSMQAGLPDQLNGPFWTMAVEFQFYMLLPLIAWVLSLIVRRGSLRWRITKLIGCLLAMLGWGLLSRWWGLFIDLSATHFPQNVLAALQPYYYGDNGKYFECFAVGMLLALLYVYTQNTPQGTRWQTRLQCWSPWMFLVGLLILGFLALFAFYTSADYHSTFVVLDSYRALLKQIYAQWQSIGYSICYGLCMCALLYNAGRLKRPFEWIVLRWIGLISFSLYMWHYPLLLLFKESIINQFNGLGNSMKLIALLAWVFFIIFPISLTFYRWMEMPGMRLGEMLIRKIEKPKKEHSRGVSIPTPTQEATATSIEMKISHSLSSSRKV